jgi:hydrogenase maturation protein HypF
MLPGVTAYPIVDYGGAELIEADHPKSVGRDVLRRGVMVRGIVQGVGFRPFVYRLAIEEGLAGSIGNDTDGVSIEVEGPPQKIEAFLSRLNSEMPPLARVDSVATQDLPPNGENGFRILSSHVVGQVSTGIPADAGTCAACLRELFDPEDRRYRYPFLNCTNCGPRFTITRRIPYDRPQTSMAKFPMCPACQAEYDDPLNRRFHAQPNACWDCGPQLTLRISRRIAKGPHSRSRQQPLSNASVSAGEIVAIKGIGGFHLSADATNSAAVERLRHRKHRYGKPLAVMVRDIDAARALSKPSHLKKKHCSKPQPAPSSWPAPAKAAESLRKLPLASHGSASSCPMLRSSIFYSPTIASELWS